MLLEPGDSSHGTRAASTGSSWVSLGGRERRRDGWKEGEKESRKEGKKEGRTWDLGEGRSRRQFRFGKS